MKRREHYGADTTTLPYAARMLVSAGLLGGLALGIVSTLAQIMLLNQHSGLVNLVFLIPLAVMCWAVVPRVWAEPAPAALRAVRSVTDANQLNPTLTATRPADRRELALARRL